MLPEEQKTLLWRQEGAQIRTRIEVDTNTEEGKQDGEKPAGEEIQGRDRQEIKTTVVKESYLETEARAEEKQANAEKSGDSDAGASPGPRHPKPCLQPHEAGQPLMFMASSRSRSAEPGASSAHLDEAAACCP
ncbi:hypothetical protein NDU88_005115 [Pleurodeles waltl]|uniref:Uncharacterized protein n=1 Tax=Pleurodeles waltl TaxID=8319 RepID=A0AAV7QED9_PLEWA|nr:hypothetical protein NDU88_005115 [Pleurodeles waltl]